MYADHCPKSWMAKQKKTYTKPDAEVWFYIGLHTQCECDGKNGVFFFK